jgi:hypothetical protein
MALLMTPTLWDSIDWLQKSPDSWKKRAYESLSNTLNRIWDPTPAIKRGIAYEKQICFGENPIDEVATEIREKFIKAYDMIHAEGHVFQKKTKKIVDFDGKEFCLYGKMDVSFKTLPDYPNGFIIDIKTTSNYRGKSSYLSKWQHKVYTWLTRIKDFMYIVYEFDEYGNMIDIHFIEYHVDDFGPIGEEIMNNLAKVVTFLRTDKTLSKAYMKKFNLYN